MTDKLLIEALVKDIHDAIAELAGVSRYPDLTEAIDKLAELARHRSQQEAAQEPAAVVGRDFQLLYTGGEDFSAHARKHGLKVGTKLYTASTAPSESEARIVVPEWLKALDAADGGNLLAKFIEDNEPAEDAREWRESVRDMLQQVSGRPAVLEEDIDAAAPTPSKGEA